MALIKVRDIYWRRNSPYGGYSAGDTVEIYYDNVGLEVVVKKNGTIVTSGNDIPFYFQSNSQNATYYKTETGGNQIEVDLVVCNGTTRIQFPRLTDFPYVGLVNHPNNPSCSVNPIVCDLIINSLPIVVNESAVGALDGEITVTGTSSNGSIEYSLNSDFVYGSGDPSGVFTGLPAGVYRVYARDEANCSDNIGVQVLTDLVYGTRYELEYFDIRGDQTKIEIQERDYVGLSEEVVGDDTPILIRQRGEGEQDKFVPVLGCEIQVGLISTVKYQFQTLFTSDQNKYRVVYSKDFGSGYEILATGKLLPNQYRESYKDAPYPVTFLATDGIASLKDSKFIDSAGNRLFGSYKAIQIIAYCLKATGLNLNIRVAINLYADDMDETASDDPLDQAYVNVESYYTDDTISYIDVIVRILEPFGAQLTQWNNVWNIVHVEEKVDEYDYREFDPSGDYVSNGSFDPRVISQENPDDGLIWVSTPEMEMNSAYGTINVNYNLGLNKNLIRNGDFRIRDTWNYGVGSFLPTIDYRGFQIVANGDDLVNIGYVGTDDNKAVAGQNKGNILTDRNKVALSMQGAEGNAYIISKPVNVKIGYFDSLVFKIRCFIPSFGQQQFPYIKVRCVITYGTFYLSSSGSWVTFPTEVVFFATNFGSYEEFSVKSVNYPDGGEDGLDVQVKVYHAYVFHCESDSLTEQRNIVTAGVLTNAGSFIPGRLYQIKTIGTTDYTIIGARSNTVGLQFYPTSAGTGTGTALDSPLGIGHRTERRDESNFTSFYYELENNVLSEDVPEIIRPNDFNVSTNPVQWVLKETRYGSYYYFNTLFRIDRIAVEYLSADSEPPEIYQASINGEQNNPYVLDKEIYHGSLSELVYSSTNQEPIITGPISNPQFNVSIVEAVVQNAEKTYLGYLRDFAGVGFTNWHRNYQSESLPLHDILLRTISAQYNRPWKRMRGALTGSSYLSPLNSVVEERDDNITYYPIALEIDDKARVFSGEFVELQNVLGDDDPDDPDTGSSYGFTTGFSLGFNA